MHTVYALKSEVDGRIYVGMTENLDRRVAEHNRGYVRSTRPFIPWKVIFTKQAENRASARKQEKKLKSGYGKEFLKAIR